MTYDYDQSRELCKRNPQNIAEETEDEPRHYWIGKTLLGKAKANGSYVVEDKFSPSAHTKKTG